MKTTLSCWLRLLWNMEPSLWLDGETPRIIDGAIHLPATRDWTDQMAAAAHAAAHLVYSPARFDGDGLGPIARALLALLEDARVEALAMRELPGLKRLWRPLHTATPATGPGFEALLERLGRSLIDPDYDDPNPWVKKGRGLFYLDVGLGLSALRTPGELRTAAMRLGHDVGQMRMQFDARGYRPAPGYRDDNRWMWDADAPEAAAPAASPCGGDDSADDSGAESTMRYPEWDRLISRLRPDWCRVAERRAADGAADSVAEAADDAVREVGDRLRAPLRSLTRRATVPGRSDLGDAFHLGALLDWGVARRLGTTPNPRVYLARRHRAAPALVWLLIDQSASTGSRDGTNRGTLLDAVVRSATATALALQHLGVAVAAAGFSSNGRHDVRMQLVKGFEPEIDCAWIARLRRLRPDGSTRLGAALRHATRRLAQREGPSRLLLVLSDGQPHDIDVHDRRYLVEDARRAVDEAARASVRAVCLVFGRNASDSARRVFGRGGVQRVGDLQDLPRAISRFFD